MRASTALNRILSLPSTVVTQVETDASGVVATVRRRRAARPVCPRCGRFGPGYDTSWRRWRHLDLAGRRLWLRARLRRLRCRVHGVVTETVDWARHAARHTRAFEQQVAWLVRRCDKTTVAPLMRCSWSTIGAIVTRVIDDLLGPDRLHGLRRIGVDEISYRKGHRYLTVVVDHDRCTVVWVAEGKSRAAFETFFHALGPDRCAELEAISMDMSTAFRSAAQAHAPQADICFDPFHVIQWAGHAMDRALSVASTGRRRLGISGRSWRTARYALRRGREHLTQDQHDLLHQLRQQRLDLFETWDLKEALRDLYRLPPQVAEPHLDEWLTDAEQSPNREMRRLAERLEPHRQGIVNAVHHGLSNSRVEGINAQIRLIHRRGYGYHSAEALTALIYLCCSRLPIDLPTRT